MTSLQVQTSEERKKYKKSYKYWALYNRQLSGSSEISGTLQINQIVDLWTVCPFHFSAAKSFFNTFPESLRKRRDKPDQYNLEDFDGH